MPPGAPHFSYLGSYRIRVDDFTTPRDPAYEPPALYLLSHTHSDHVNGLNARSFGSRVICSTDSKHMLLNYEAASDRIAFDRGSKTERVRPFSHLKIDPLSSVGTLSGVRERMTRDLLVSILRTLSIISWADKGAANTRIEHSN